MIKFFNYLNGISGKHAKIFLLISSLLIIIIGLIYSLKLGHELTFADEKAYYKLAINLKNTGHYTLDGTTPCSFRPPGYPFLMLPFVCLGITEIGLRFINFLALAACAWIIFILLKKYFGNSAAVFGALLPLTYPVFFYIAGTLYPQIFYSAVYMLVVYLLFTKTIRNIWFFLATGLLYGFLILSIPSFILNLFILLILILFWYRKILYVIFFLTGTVITLIPWTIRNYSVLGGFAIVDTHSGLNFLYGNSENTTPNGGSNVDISIYNSAVYKMNDLEKDRFYRKAGFEYILNHKKESIIMYFKKVLNYFNYENELKTKKASSHSANIIMLISYAFLLVLIAARFLIRKFPFTRIEIVLFVLFITNPFLHAIFFTRIRYRIPHDFILICLAAISIHYLLKIILNKAPRSGVLNVRHEKPGK